MIGSDEMGPDTAISQLKSAGVDVEIVNTELTLKMAKTYRPNRKRSHTEDHHNKSKPM
ncbi:hypothetical protein OH492_10780 [Vibrio chagasii]|nr:hypothetical protein [Vibrio chagasii]